MVIPPFSDNYSNPAILHPKTDVMAYNSPTARTVMAFSVSLVGQLPQRTYGVRITM